MDNIDKHLEQITAMAIEFSPKIILAVLTLIVGLWLIKMVGKGVQRTMAARDVDVSLQTFVTSLCTMTLKALLILSIAGMVGIEVTSFIAIFGAAGLAVGMALSGTLQNFAGGVMLMLFKPYKVGDFVEVQGYAGTVKAIQIFNTILKTGDNKTIIIPNAPISTSSMINYSTEATRRVDLNFGIGYNDDIDQAKAVLLSIIEKDERVFTDPAPFIAVSELADNSVNFVVRIWVNAGDYWGVHFAMLENVKKGFDENKISIPYPQQDVHMHQVSQ